MTRTWPIDAPSCQEVGDPGERIHSVSVTLVGGRLDVVAHEGARGIRYDVHEVTGRPLTAMYDSGSFRLEQHRDPQGRWWETVKGLASGSRDVVAAVTLTVPPGTRVTVHTVSAEVLVGGVGGAVTVNTVSGPVGLARLAGRVDVRTVGGDVRAAGLTGELRTKTVSGRVTVDGSALRAARLGTVSGAVDLLLGSGDAPADLRRRVTSPKGTTERAVAVFDRDLDALVLVAMQDAVARAQEIAASS